VFIRQQVVSATTIAECSLPCSSDTDVKCEIADNSVDMAVCICIRCFWAFMDVCNVVVCFHSLFIFYSGVCLTDCMLKVITAVWANFWKFYDGWRTVSFSLFSLREVQFQRSLLHIL